MEDSNNK